MRRLHLCSTDSPFIHSGWNLFHFVCSMENIFSSRFSMFFFCCLNFKEMRQNIIQNLPLVSFYKCYLLIWIQHLFIMHWIVGLSAPFRHNLASAFVFLLNKSPKADFLPNIMRETHRKACPLPLPSGEWMDMNGHCSLCAHERNSRRLNCEHFCVSDTRAKDHLFPCMSCDLRIHGT